MRPLGKGSNRLQAGDDALWPAFGPHWPARTRAGLAIAPRVCVRSHQRLTKWRSASTSAAHARARVPRGLDRPSAPDIRRLVVVFGVAPRAIGIQVAHLAAHPFGTIIAPALKLQVAGERLQEAPDAAPA